MARPNRLLLLLTALLIGSVAILAGPVPLRGLAMPQEQVVQERIVISEFRAIGPDGGNDEFVELYNPTSVPIDISGWVLKTSNSNNQTRTLLTVPPGTTILSGQSYLIVNVQAPASLTSQADVTYDPAVVGHITNAGGIAIIDAGNIVDQVGMDSGSAYKEGSTLPPLTGAADESYERSPTYCTDTSDNLSDFQRVSPSSPGTVGGTGGCILPDTTTVITSHQPDPSLVGQRVTVRFNVSPNAATGLVTISSGSDSCTVNVVDGECDIKFTSSGSRQITAVYEGDPNFMGSTSNPVTHVVNKINTTTKITADNPDPSNTGQGFVVTFKVTPAVQGYGKPTGTVTISTGSNTCQGTLSAGGGSCTLVINNPGTYGLTAAYSGDQKFKSSTTAAPRSHRVKRAPTPTITPTRTVGPPAGFSVVINEVAWSGTAASGADEWIELYNPTDSPIDLTGWRLRAADLNPNIALEGVIPARGYFLLEREDDNTVKGPGMEANQIYTTSPLSNELSDVGEKLYLYRGFSIIDYANTLSNTWLAGSVTNHRSMERRGLVSDSRTTWVTNTGVRRNGLDANGNPINGTPKNQNWAYTVTLTPSPRATIIPTRTKPPVARPVLNEFLVRAGFDWNRDGRIDVFDEFIEIANLGPVDWNTSGWKLDDEANGGSPPFAIPQMTLKPGERAVFYGFQTNIRLSDGGDTVRLLNQSNVVYDSQTYPVIKASDESWCRLPDIRGSWYPDCFPTPNFPNERQGQVPSMPPGTGLEEPLCTLADTLPEEFILAECRAYGENMWSAWYWNLQAGLRQFLVDQNGSKWEVWVE